jgi:two-component system chemotaxis sensor kinase CheA
MAMNEAEFLKRLQEAFRVEAEEHLQAMSAGLLELEKAAPGDQAALLESIYREAHSLKGAARAVNFTAIESICQSLESVFSAWKRGDSAPSPEAFDPLLNALDAIGQLTAAPPGQAQDNATTNRISELARQIDALAREAKTPVAATPGAPPAATRPTPGDSNASPPPQPTNGATGSGSAGNGVIVGRAAANGSTPTNGSPPNGPHPPQNGAGPKTVESQQPSSSPPPPHHPVETTRTEVHHAETATETVRIATAKLDSLLRQAEEMVAVKLVEGQRAIDLREIVDGLEHWKKEWNKVAPAAGALRQANAINRGSTERRGSDDGVAAGGATAPTAEVLNFLEWNSGYLKELQDKMATLSKTAERDRRTIGGLVDNLLDDSKKLLMLPFSTMLAGFPKLVRDVSKELGKEVELMMHGGDVEIDKRILEEMKAPLVHLLRNSIDHGLEKPQERLQQGKPARGTISIDIMQMGGRVEIAVSDDGAGIDTERVRAAAIDQGASAEEINALGERDAAMLIFKSDLSTSAAVTELSGRGLGMAIVREKVEKLGGQIALESQPGRGTTFRIALPLTLATFRGILVRVSEHIFVLPTAHVAMAARIKPDTIQTAGNVETISHHGRAVSLVHLADILEMPRSAATTGSDFVPIIILGSGDQHIAFTVDEVLDEQEVLIKSQGKPLVRVRNVEGVTVLGTGRVVPVLNVADLLKSARRPGSRAPRTVLQTDEAAVPEQSKRRMVLVAEDSITSRMLLKNILESAGYSVVTAVDGMDALTTLRAGHFDLVVSDIDMPRMTGLDLTAAIRADARLSEVPVVLVTARDSREDRERGIDVGASAYVVKTSFDQSNLLDVVRRLV